jgi:hypothetical protein
VAGEGVDFRTIFARVQKLNLKLVGCGAVP